ncbi:MAG TPA: hypothetical protein VMZ04_08760 [Anaerolineae bacterium]|nr:hypothetical protein [Anaerolineae bacterium]
MSGKKPINKDLNNVLMVLLAALWVTSAAADSIPPQVYLDTGWEQYEPGVIKATVLDNAEVSDVTLFYRKHGEAYYNSIKMRHENDIYYRALNRELGMEGTVEYYLLAQDLSGNQVTEPRMNPEENPLTAAMSGDVNQSEPEVTLSNPEPGAVLDSGDEMVIVTFFITEREIDFNTVRFKVDKRDRTSEADFIGNVLIWEPRRPLADGFHEIEVIARDTNGNYIGPNIWTFRVKTKREMPLGAEGDFYIGIQRDDRSGKNQNVPLWNNKMDLGINGQTGWLNWSAGMMLSSEETTFLTSEDLPNRQPINRFYLDGRSRYFRIRVGDSNPNFSELTVKGILVRGANLEFKSNHLQAQFVKGYNKREINEDIQVVEGNVTPVAGNPNAYLDQDGQEHSLTSFQQILQDPVTGAFRVYEFVPGVFKRDVTAVQMDVVPIISKYATWKLGFNFFSAEDDSTSLEIDYNTKDPGDDGRYYSYVTNGDTTFFSTNYKPKKNWASTFETSLRFNNNRSELSAEFGSTLVTENMFGSLPEDIKDELPENINDDLFRFNGSTQTSFDKSKIKDNVSKGIGDIMSSIYIMRLTTPVPIPKASTYFKGEMYRIPTHYTSLGNPQQKTDIGGFKFDVRTRILRDQVTFNFGYDSYSDNLDDERKQYAAGITDTGVGNIQKSLTKDTNVASFSVGVRPHVFAEYQPNVTIGYRAYTAENDLDISVTSNNPRDKIDASTNTLMVSLGGMLPFGLQRHTGILSFTNMGITDDRPLKSYELNESNNLTIIANVNSVINPLPLTLNTSIGRTNNASYRPLLDEMYAPYDRKEITTGITMINVAGTYKWFRDKRLSTTAGIGYLGSSNKESGQYKIENTKTSIKFEANYKLSSVTSAGALVRFINYADNANSENDYTEPIFGITLRSAF